MAFVKEIIPEKDWDLFNSWKLKDTQGELIILKEREEDYYKQRWFVDRERGIYYILLGGEDKGLIDVYALIWKGEKIIIQLRRCVNYEIINGIEKKTLHYDVFRIIVSPNLKSTTTANEVRNIVVETVKADVFRNKQSSTGFVFDNVATPFFG